MRLIDADALVKRMKNTWDMQDLYLPVHFEELVEDEPTVDNQEPVEPIMTDDPYTFIHCGCCDEIIHITDKYCSNCGRKVKWDD